MSVSDRPAADTLCRPFQRHLVLSLIGRDASVSELVSESGPSMRALHYQIVRLLEVGLLKIASHEAWRPPDQALHRGGRGVLRAGITDDVASRRRLRA